MMNRPRSPRRFSRFIRRSARRVLCGVLSSVLLFQPILQAGAQGIVPDGSGGKAPGVVAAPNGVPVINVQAPNASGISHNQYQNFNVGTQGVVLNNSPNAGRSELGGIVLGNPNYTNGKDSRLIINEVTSANRSHLNGFAEVYGRAADVIISNPHGITCDGCGFINTPRATLSTGRPVIGADGTLNGLDVNDGDIAIQGRGADASRIDAFDIVSRRVTIEAPASAKNEINIIAGRNQVDYATRAVTAKADDGSTKPTVSIDSRALGGMYSGKISLVSTEKGVGVNMRSDAAAHSGEMTLTADGRIVMSGRTSSAGDTKITSHSSDVEIEKQLGASGKVAVTAAKGKVTVKQGATVAGDKGVAITARDIANAGTTQSLSTVALTASQKIDNSGTTAANDHVGVTAATVANSGIFQSNGLLYVKGHASIDNSGTMMAARTLDLSGGTLRNSNTLATDGAFLFNNSHLENTATGKIQFRNDLALVLPGLFDNAGLIETTGAFSLVAGGINNRSTGVLHSGKSMDLRSVGAFGNDGRIEAFEILTLSAASIDNRAGSILRANGLLDLKSTAGLNNAGQMSGANGLRLDAGQALSNSGRLVANGTLSLRAASLTNTAGAAIQSQGDLSVILAGSFWNAGLLEAAGGITVTASGAIDNRGEVLSGNDLTLAGTRLDNRGMLHTDGKLQLNTGDVVNAASGKLQAGGDLFAVLWGSLSNAGVLLGSRTLDLKVTGTLTNTHEIYAGETMRLVAGEVTNTGLISSMGVLRGTLSSLANRGSLQAGSDMTLTGLASLHNTETLLALGNLKIEVRDSLVNEYGNILAGDLLQLRGQGGGRMGSLQNLSGTIESFDGNVDIAAQSLINAKAVFEMETVRTETLYEMLEENEHFDFNSLPGYQDTRWDNAKYFKYVVLVPDPVLGYDFATYYGVSSSGYSIYVWEDRSTVTRDSAPGVISAGRDLKIDAGYLLNDKSTIMSGEDMILTGDVLENVGAVSTYQYWHASKAYGLFTRCFGGRYCEWFYNAGGEHLWIDEEIERHDASIVAGGDLSGSFRDRIDNTLIRERSNILPPGGKIKVTEVASGAADQRNPGNIVPPELSGASSAWKSDARFTSVVNLAMSSLFRPASPSSPYLYESRAQFSSFGHFYGSDYFLSAINFNPDVLVKRLGDAFFDTRLIREEVLRQTGQRWLDGSARNDGDEMKRLMDNGIAASASLGLLPGQAPTAEQLAALDSDMVWYVWQDIGGQKVLGPQLYLAADSKRRAEGGAVIAGTDVDLWGGTLTNEGAIYSRNLLALTTDGDLVNRGGLISGETVLLSAGRDLINNAAMTSISSANNSNILLAGLGRIESSGSLALFAERDVAMRGGNVAAGKDLSISAQGNVTLESEVQRNQFTAGGGSSVTRSDDIRNIGSLVSAEGNVQIVAGKQLTVAGSGVVAGKDATLSGKEGVTITSVTDESHAFQKSSKKSTFKSSSYSMQKDITTEMGSVIAAGNDLKIVSGGNVAIRASVLNAGNDLLLAAGAGADGRKDASVTIEAGQNTSFFEEKIKKSGFSFGGLNMVSGAHSFGYSSTKTTSGQSGTQTAGSHITVGNNLTILAAQDVNISGSQVLAGNNALLSAGHDVNITTAQESSKSWYDSKSSGFGVSVGSKIFAGATSAKDSVRQDGTYSVGSVLSAGNDLTIDAGRNAMISGSWLSAGRDMADQRPAGGDHCRRQPANHQGKP